MPLTTETDLYHAALRLGPPSLAAEEPGPVTVTGPGGIPRSELRPALDRCGRWLNEQFGPHLRVLIGVSRDEDLEPGLYRPGEAAPLTGSAAQVDGLRAAGMPVSLLWFGDPAAAGSGLGALLVRVGWGAQTVRTALEAAGYRAALDARAGVVHRPGVGGHLGSVLVARSAGAGS
ncbi:hypothetical protein GCM10010297_40980 [Streptomyces malachitofuscus]|nr:hypothetical protein GCM10010297_40980 [Streptomyces malachitofuscus]